MRLGENYHYRSRLSITTASPAAITHSSSGQIDLLLDQPSNASATTPAAVIDPSNTASPDEITELKKRLQEQEKQRQEQEKQTRELLARDQAREKELKKIKAQIGDSDASMGGQIEKDPTEDTQHSKTPKSKLRYLRGK